MTGTRLFIMPSEAEFVSGCRMPSSQTILAGDSAVRQAAEQGSSALLAAIDRYYRKGGRG